jgi:hypothetical protein
MTQFLLGLSCIKKVNACILRQMMSYDIVKNISKLKKQVAKFRETVYTKDRSKCLPLADGAGYK